jgi:hypothetical protein
MLLRWSAQFVGFAFVVLGLVDVFLAVLYARSGVGLISRFLIPLTWRFFRAVGARIPSQSVADLWLAFCGPTMIVLLVGVWLWTEIVGFGLMIWPRLGNSIVSTQGPQHTATNLGTAFTLAGDCMTTVGSPEFTPATTAARLLILFASIIGLCMITLVLAFLVEIYNALLRRNTFALALEFSSDRTGDGARLLAALGPGDDFTATQTELSTMATELINLYESHHFYSSLLYFRFREPYYALSRMLLVIMDAMTLLQTALDDEHHGKLKRSSAVLQLHHGAMHMLKDLSRAFLPHGGPNDDAGRLVGRTVTDEWQRRFDGALDCLRRAGITITNEPDAAARRYAEVRREWDPFIVAFASYMAHPLDAIDTATADE